MTKKLKEYRFTSYYRGIHLTCMVVAPSLKTVCDLFGIGLRYARAYVSIIEPRTTLCIDNPLLRVAEFESSGEAGYFLPKHKIGVPMRYENAKDIIDEHRETFRTYKQTVDHYEKRR